MSRQLQSEGHIETGMGICSCLDDFAYEPRNWLELEFSYVVIQGLEEELIVWFRQDNPREQI